MFGLLKESILETLSNDYYQDKKTFKRNVKMLIGEAKKSKVFQKYLSTYQMIDEARFVDIDEARSFVDETINYMKKMDSSGLNKFFDTIKMNESYTSRRYELIDSLLSENTSIIERSKYKTELIKLLVNSENATTTQETRTISIDPTYENVFNRILARKLSDKISALTEDEQKVLHALIKEDKTSIESVYCELIDENLNHLSKLVNESKTLVENELKKMRSEQPTTMQLLKLIQLKKDLEDVG